MAIKVKLRQKKISKGRKSFYLDFYPPIPHPKTGKPTRREFLGLYILENPKKENEKRHNKDTTNLAERIRAKRENALNKPEIYSEYEKEQLRKKELGERSFLEYFKALTNKRIGSNKHSWTSALNYLEAFIKTDLKFADLNESFFNDFKEYLLTTKSKRSNKATLSRNSAVSYFNKIKAALKQAFQDGILQEDLNSKIRPIKPEETHREFLTIEELNALVRTPCNNQLIKDAALFSALTGLRFSDIQKLTWGEISHIKGQGYIITFKQQKTQGAEVLPISDQAFELAGKPGESNEQVFKGLKYSAYHNNQLYQWLGAAGITKKDFIP
jgi:integrase